MINATKQYFYSGECSVTKGNFTFQEVHDEFRPKILRYLTRMVGEHEAEDMTQEVFVKVSRALPAFKRESSLSTWIYKIATNTALDRLRKNPFRSVPKEDPFLDSAAEDLGKKSTVTDYSSTEQRIIRGETNACIRGVIDRLPDNYRTVIVLSDIEGLQDSEVAKILGLNLQAAKIRLHRARERLKKELSQYCVFYRDEENEFTCDVKDNHKESI
jgi:RNA polymerase sigma-70 factor (ECF subfamily)